MDDPTQRILKLLWFPVLLLLMVVAGSYLGISKAPYRWAYLGVQILLFIVYSYILFRGRPKYVAGEKKLKGKRG